MIFVSSPFPAAAVDKDDGGGSLLTPALAPGTATVLALDNVPIADMVDEEESGFEWVPPALLVPRGNKWQMSKDGKYSQFPPSQI